MEWSTLNMVGTSSWAEILDQIKRESQLSNSTDQLCFQTVDTMWPDTCLHDSLLLWQTLELYSKINSFFLKLLLLRYPPQQDKQLIYWGNLDLRRRILYVLSHIQILTFNLYIYMYICRYECGYMSWKGTTKQKKDFEEKEKGNRTLKQTTGYKKTVREGYRDGGKR